MEMKWIQCSDRMPKKHTDVLITLQQEIEYPDETVGYIYITLYAQRVTCGWDVCDTNDAYTVFDNDDTNRVVAWMPIPEPLRLNETKVEIERDE